MNIIQTKGKRKSAIARAVFKQGKGRIRINNVPLELYKPALSRMEVNEVLSICDPKVVNKVDVDLTVKGGGFMGQTDAIRCALGRGFVQWSKDMKLRETFLHYDKTIIRGDHRRKEPKKCGGPGARARKQKSYR